MYWISATTALTDLIRGKFVSGKIFGQITRFSRF